MRGESGWIRRSLNSMNASRARPGGFYGEEQDKVADRMDICRWANVDRWLRGAVMDGGWRMMDESMEQGHKLCRSLAVSKYHTRQKMAAEGG